MATTLRLVAPKQVKAVKKLRLLKNILETVSKPRDLVETMIHTLDAVLKLLNSPTTQHYFKSIQLKLDAVAGAYTEERTKDSLEEMTKNNLRVKNQTKGTKDLSSPDVMLLHFKSYWLRNVATKTLPEFRMALQLRLQSAKLMKQLPHHLIYLNGAFLSFPATETEQKNDGRKIVARQGLRIPEGSWNHLEGVTMLSRPEPEERTEIEPKGASQEQLTRVYMNLLTNLPEIFVRPLDYSIYHADMIFENNLRGTRTVGLYQYIKQVAFLRMVGHIKFAHVKFDILRITLHTEDSTVRVRWRIHGLSGLRLMLMLCRNKLLRHRVDHDDENDEELWYDGFSTYHVGPEGQVVKHVADSLMPDQEEEQLEGNSIRTRLALLLGLTVAPRSLAHNFCSHFSPFLSEWLSSS